MIDIYPDGTIFLSEPKYLYKGSPVYTISHSVWKENQGKGLDLKLLMQHNLIRVKSKKVKDSLYEQSGHKPIWFHKWYISADVAQELGE